MKTYAAFLTVAMSEVLTMFILWTFTQMELFSICFWCILAAIAALYAFGCVTEPKKKKDARWQQCGSLNVLVQGKRK